MVPEAPIASPRGRKNEMIMPVIAVTNKGKKAIVSIIAFNVVLS